MSLLIAACEAGDGAPTPPSAPASAVSSALPVQSTLGPVPPSVRWKPGDQRTFSLDLHTKAELQGAPLAEIRWKAKLVATALPTNSAVAVLHLAPGHAELTTELDALRPTLVQLAKELNTPFSLELDAQGALSSLRFTDEPSSLVTGLRQTLAASLQATRRGSDSTWIRQEQDGTGAYEAQYDLAPHPQELRKRKLRYTTIYGTNADKAPNKDGLIPTVSVSDIVIRLDADGALDSVESKEELGTPTSPILPVRTSTQLGLRTVGKAAATEVRLADIQRAMSGARVRPLGPGAAPAVDSPQMDDVRIANQSLEEVLAGLRTTDMSGKPGEPVDEESAGKRAKLFAALCALVRRRPETVPALVRLIDKGDPLAPTLIDALGSGGSDQAQRAVATMLKKKALPSEQLAGALVTLSQTPRPTEEATARLVSLLDEKGLRIQAFYGLGTHARVLREAGEQQRASRILKVILDRLESAKDTVTQVTALRAVANSADEQALPRVRTFFRADSESVRAAAIESLHGMRHSDVDAILTRTLTDEPSASVRRASARAMVRRDPNEAFEKAAGTVLRTERDPNLRLDTLRVLVKWLSKRPELAATIRYVADHDGEESIRKEARSALEAFVLRKP